MGIHLNSFNLTLLGSMVAALIVSGVAASMLRGASEELGATIRDVIFRKEDKLARFWHAAEWIGIGLILLAMFGPGGTVFAKASQRLFCIAGGLALFCLSNAASSWAANAIYRREAPNTKAAGTAFRAAILVTIAELLLVAVVGWKVYDRIDWSASASAKSDGAPAEVEQEESGVWLDESIALKELAKLNRGYIDGMIESGALRTKTVGGKKMYNARDVEALKSKKQDVIPD